MSAKVAEFWNAERGLRKDGRPAKRFRYWTTPYCPIERCSRCRRWGSVTWVKRWSIRPAALFNYGPEDPLCMACMNRLRPLWQALRLIDENRILINRLPQEARRAAA